MSTACGGSKYRILQYQFIGLSVFGSRNQYGSGRSTTKMAIPQDNLIKKFPDIVEMWIGLEKMEGILLMFTRRMGACVAPNRKAYCKTVQ